MRKTNAFTLIELLVVIAIIALLMAVLMPAMSRVRKQARTIACQSNLHEWALIFAMYTGDNNGFLMTGYASQGTATTSDRYLDRRVAPRRSRSPGPGRTVWSLWACGGRIERRTGLPSVRQLGKFLIPAIRKTM